uniref:Uncharacterized protein n=1 Tax=Ornithorhynchus anatinus TaxID=9258 RepID=A0A6I8PFP9_ORNAN
RGYRDPGSPQNCPLSPCTCRLFRIPLHQPGLPATRPLLNFLLEEMGGRITDLQKNVSVLMIQAGIDPSGEEASVTPCPGSRQGRWQSGGFYGP